MNQINIIVTKKNYSQPSIYRIELDNQISLALASDANPDGEPTFSKSSEYFVNDPFKMNNA